MSLLHKALTWTAVGVLALCSLEAQQQADDAAQATAGQEAETTRILRVEHVRAEHAAGVLGTIVQGKFKYNNPLGVIAVTGTEEELDTYEQALREIDQPRSTDYRSVPYQNVALTVYFLGVAADGEQVSVPDELDGVVEELRRHFPYSSYRLLETFGIRATRKKAATVEGVIPGSTEPAPTTYGFKAVIDKITGAKGQEFVDFEQIGASWRVPVPQPGGGFTYSEMHLSTMLGVPASKLVVVGKAGAADVTDGLFVVLRADVIESP